MKDVDPRLQRLLGGDELAPLRERLRRRFERDAAVSSIRLDDLTTVERTALTSLAGLPVRKARSLLLDVEAVDSALVRAQLASSLREALEKLDGPIVDRAAARAEEQARWEGLAHSCHQPQLRDWIAKPANLGVVKRITRNDSGVAQGVLGRVEATFERLPCHGLPRSQLAAEVLGDAHALDSGRAEAAIILAVLRDGRFTDDLEREPEEVRTRDLWAEVGVLVNELARPALFLNVPFDAVPGWTARRGEPHFASLRFLLRSPPSWRVAGATVFVCENANFVAIAADRLGVRCAPLVCTDGMPGAAQRVMLHQLRAVGACLRYHGDFDWPGVRIAAHVFRAHGASPWRMGFSDYEQAVHGMAPATAARLSGTAVSTEWDTELSSSMQRRGIAIAEEAVFAELLRDLEGANVPDTPGL